ncbi:46494_t:CDS:2 [Gigaspora margarita]|uniref:46494_t:CDS:1 n=1 Tax=Gigaspora margarita TaxID=4874 RepID=A0ABN7UC13_GIGMA|nr:46494_t:CDS:2 [Gigaspora margarita]
MTSSTKHNTTGNPMQGTSQVHMRFLPNNPYIEQQQHAIHSNGSPEIEIQHATLDNNMFFDISDEPVLNLEDWYITEKMETESNVTIQDNAPKKEKQRSYSKAITRRWKRDNE